MARLKNAKLESNNTVNFVGPLKWMAPEAFLNCEYSRKSDVFSFGVVVWEIVTRTLPWAECTPVQASHAVAKGQRLQIPADCPSILKDIMTMAWREDPRRRPEAVDIMETLKGAEIYINSLKNNKKSAPVPPPCDRTNSQTSEYAKMPENTNQQPEDDEYEYESENDQEVQSATSYSDSAEYDSHEEQQESDEDDDQNSESQTHTVATSRRTEDDRSEQYLTEEDEEDEQ
jgi:serine/threonine protein kinase